MKFNEFNTCTKKTILSYTFTICNIKEVHNQTKGLKIQMINIKPKVEYTNKNICTIINGTI